MPGKKPDRRDLPPGKFGDEDHAKAMEAWRKSYTDAGLPVPREEAKPDPNASPMPGKKKAPPLDISAPGTGGELAANQGSAKKGTEVFVDHSGRYVNKRATGMDKDAVATAKAQEAAQEAVAEAAGGEKLEFPEPAPIAPPKDAPAGDQAKYHKAKRDWVHRREAWALKQPKAKKPAKVGGELFPR